MSLRTLGLIKVPILELRQLELPLSSILAKEASEIYSKQSKEDKNLRGKSNSRSYSQYQGRNRKKEEAMIKMMKGMGK